MGPETSSEPEKKVKPMRILIKPTKATNSTDSQQKENQPVGPPTTTALSLSTDLQQKDMSIIPVDQVRLVKSKPSMRETARLVPTKNETVQLGNPFNATKPVQELQTNETKSQNFTQQLTLETTHKPVNKTTFNAGETTIGETMEKLTRLNSSMSTIRNEPNKTPDKSMHPVISKDPTQKPVKSVDAAKPEKQRNEATTAKPKEMQKPLQPPKSMAVKPKPVKLNKPPHSERGYKKPTQTVKGQSDKNKKTLLRLETMRTIDEQKKLTKPPGNSDGLMEANATVKLKRDQVKMIKEKPVQPQQQGIRCSRFGC